MSNAWRGCRYALRPVLDTSTATTRDVGNSAFVITCDLLRMTSGAASVLVHAVFPRADEEQAKEDQGELNRGKISTPCASFQRAEQMDECDREDEQHAWPEE